MDASNEATTTSQNMETGSHNPQPKNQGRFKNAPWKKLLVYDCKRKVLELKNEEDISQSLTSFITHPRAELTRASSSDIDRCQKVDLPPRRSQVNMFVDWDTESKVSAKPIAEDGRSNLGRFTLELDRLGGLHKLRRKFGLLKVVYVTNVEEESETASQRGGEESDEGAGLSARSMCLVLINDQAGSYIDNGALDES